MQICEETRLVSMPGMWYNKDRDAEKHKKVCGGISIIRILCRKILSIKVEQFTRFYIQCFGDGEEKVQ